MQLAGPSARLANWCLWQRRMAFTCVPSLLTTTPLWPQTLTASCSAIPRSVPQKSGAGSHKWPECEARLRDLPGTPTVDADLSSETGTAMTEESRRGACAPFRLGRFPDIWRERVDDTGCCVWVLRWRSGFEQIHCCHQAAERRRKCNGRETLLFHGSGGMPSFKRGRCLSETQAAQTGNACWLLPG